MPYNIVPVDAPSLTNAISFFPEVCILLYYYAMMIYQYKEQPIFLC